MAEAGPPAAGDLKVEDVDEPTGEADDVRNDASAAPPQQAEEDDDPFGAALLSAAEAVASKMEDGDDAADAPSSAGGGAGEPTNEEETHPTDGEAGPPRDSNGSLQPPLPSDATNANSSTTTKTTTTTTPAMAATTPAMAAETAATAATAAAATAKTAATDRKSNFFQRVAAALGFGPRPALELQAVVHAAATKEGLELPGAGEDRGAGKGAGGEGPFGMDNPGAPLAVAAPSPAPAPAAGAVAIVPPSPAMPPVHPQIDDKFFIRWNPRELGAREATCVRVRRDAEVDKAVGALGLDGYVKRCQGDSMGKQSGGSPDKPSARVKGAILVVGDSAFRDDRNRLSAARESRETKQAREETRGDGNNLGAAVAPASAEIESRLKMVFSRGIAVAAASKSAVVITAGVDKGPVGHMGRAAADHGYQFPMLGVVPEGGVTWNGDVRPATDARSRLQTDHTHLLMLECNSFDDAAEYRFEVAARIVRPAPGEREHALPAVVVCVGGGESELEQALRGVRRGWPLVVLKGSGGVADALAWAADPDNRGAFVPNPAIMEAVKDGKIEVVDVSTADGKVTSAMLERLFDDVAVERPSRKRNADARAETPPRSRNCQLMWDQIKLYKRNAMRLAGRAAWLQSMILWLNVLLTALVTVKMFSNSSKAPDVMRSSDAALGVFNLAVVLLPICISVFIAVVNYFQFNLKADILHAAADYMTSQLYSHRATKTHRDAAEKNEQHLGAILGHVTEAVVSTQVGSMSLVECSAEGETAVRNAIGMHEDDDAVSRLSSQQYLRYRPGLRRASAGRSTGDLAAENLRLRCVIFVLGGGATVLAVFHYTIFIALTTALATTFAAIIETNNYVPRVVARNRCRRDLSGLKGRWHALTPVEQADAAECSELVRRMEAAILTEVKFSNPAAAMLADVSPVYAAFDVDGLVGDIAENLTRGGKAPFRFASNWMDKHKAFFEAFHAWYAGKHRKRRVKSGSLSALANRRSHAARPAAIADSPGDDSLAGLTENEATGASEGRGTGRAKGSTPALHDDDDDDGGYGGGAVDGDDTVRSMDGDAPAGGPLALYNAASGRDGAGDDAGMGMELAATPNPRPIEVSEILWDPDRFFLRTSRCVHVNTRVGAETADQVHRSLQLGAYYRGTTGDGGVKGAIVVIGASARLDDFLKNARDEASRLPDRISPQEGIARLRMVFNRGVIRAARATRAVVFSAGVDVGPCAFAGAANRAHGHVVPVVGVVSKSKVTWPGDERDGNRRRVPLQPDHTHFVTLAADDGVSRARFTFELIRRVTEDGKRPSVAVVVNGDVSAMAAVLMAVRGGTPIVIIRGTGGLADLLSRANADPLAFASDNDVAEIIQDGFLCFFELSELDGAVVDETLTRLFGHSDDSPPGKARGMDHGGRGGAPMSQHNKVAPYGLSDGAEGVGFHSVAPGGGASRDRDEEIGLDATRGGGGGGGEDRSLARHLNNVIAAWAKVLIIRGKAGACKSVAGRVKTSLLVLGVLMTFVASLLYFVEENVAVEELARLAPPPPPPVAAAAGISLETLNAYSKLPGWLSSPSVREGMTLALLLLPIVAGIITSVDNELGYRAKAALLDAAAESMKSEIFKYRAGVGEYSDTFYARNALLGRSVDAVYDALVSTGAGELGGLTEMAETNGAAVVGRVAETEKAFAPDDDFYSQLTPEDYVTHRLECLTRRYKKLAARAETWEHRLNVPLYLLQGLSMGFALVDRFQVFMAVTTVLTSAVVAVKASAKSSEKLFVYNRSLAALTGILTRWRSLSAVEKANPQKFAKLVEDVESVTRAEMQSSAPGGGRGCGDDRAASEHFQPSRFRQDVVDHTDPESQLRFKMSWIERHPFFAAYQAWMDEQGMWEDAREGTEGDATLPPLEGGAAGVPFLESNLVSVEPARLGHELTRRWQKCRSESEKMTDARWQAMGPEPPAPLGCRYVASARANRVGGGGAVPLLGSGSARDIERDPDWAVEDGAPVDDSSNAP